MDGLVIGGIFFETMLFVELRLTTTLSQGVKTFFLKRHVLNFWPGLDSFKSSSNFFFLFLTCFFFPVLQISIFFITFSDLFPFGYKAEVIEEIVD